MVKLAGILFFISFVFISSSSAQTIEKNTLSNDAETPGSNFLTESRRQIGLGKNPFATGVEKNTKPFENREIGKLLDEKSEKGSVEQNNYKFRRGEKEWNVDFGFSPLEPTHFVGEKPFNTAGRKLGLMVFRWGRVFGTVKGVTYQYLVEVSPLVVSLKNEVVNYEYVSPAATPNLTPTKRETSYGVGITPLAFRFYFLPESRIKPFVQLGAGIIFFNKPTPLPKTSKFNFTGYFGGGLMINTSRNRAITLSYRYFHISNGNTQHVNPGYNANVFGIGYSFFYGK